MYRLNRDFASKRGRALGKAIAFPHLQISLPVRSPKKGEGGGSQRRKRRKMRMCVCVNEYVCAIPLECTWA